MSADDFIAEAVARKRPMNANLDIFGMPFALERDGELIFQYDCQDASVCLYVDREKLGQGTVNVIVGEAVLTI